MEEEKISGTILRINGREVEIEPFELPADEVFHVLRIRDDMDKIIKQIKVFKDDFDKIKDI